MTYRPDFLEKLECENQSPEQCIWMVDVLAEQYASDCFGLELATELHFEIFHTALLTAHCLFKEIPS